MAPPTPLKIFSPVTRVDAQAHLRRLRAVHDAGTSSATQALYYSRHLKLWIGLVPVRGSTLAAGPYTLSIYRGCPC